MRTDGEVEVPPRRQAVLPARHRERGAQPEERRLRLLDQPPLEAEIGPAGVPVDHHDRAAREQDRDERVPHHPRGRREPEEPVVGTEVPAQHVVLQLLDEEAAVPVDDRLRQARRAGGEQHAERMVERERVELERPRLGHELVPLARVGQLVVRPADERDMDDGLDRRQLLADLGDLVAPVDEPVAVPVAGRREQHLRLELAEPVDDAAHAELRRRRRPDRAEARGREERDERLRNVREVADDAVAGADAEPLQSGAGARDLVAQLAVGELDRIARLRMRDDRDLVQVLVAADHVLRVVQRRAGEPHRSGHRVVAQHAFVRRVRADLEEVPERAPEALEIGHRPAVKLVVAGERETALVLEPLEQPAELGPRIRGRRPEDIAG